MKKILSLMMVMALVSSSTFSTSASAAAQISHLQMIGNTFDQFRYRMTVDGNPSTPGLQNQATNDFRTQLSRLQEQGVATSEILSYLRTSILDASARQDFDLMISNLSPQTSPQETNDMILQFMSAKYQNGASYSGGAIASVALAVIVAGAITFFLIMATSGKKGDGDHDVDDCRFDSNGSFSCIH